MRPYQNLRILQLAREIHIGTIRATDQFPAHERYEMTSQMRRSAGSAAYCIVEGSGRGTEPQFLKSLRESAGEGSELHYQLGVAIELGYGRREELQRLYELEERFLRMHTRLQAVIRQRIRQKKLVRRPSLKRAQRASPEAAPPPPEQGA